VYRAVHGKGQPLFSLYESVPWWYENGASKGGVIAQEMAVLHAHRVRTLTTIMSTTGIASGESGVPADRRRPCFHPGLE